MGSAKQQSAVSKVMGLLEEWDKGSKAVRRQILQDFIAQNYNKTGPELEAEFAEAASLFLARLTAWLRLTYMIGTCLSEQLSALQIFMCASSGHKFLGEFLEVGGLLTVLEILGLKQAKESDKNQALRLLMCIAGAGRKYKELICESYGIRAVAECLAKSRSEDTQECARSLLHELAQGNPKYQMQVYKGFIALLPCSSPKAQQMAAQTIRLVQPIVQTVNPGVTEPCLNLLKTLHMEVQYEAIELIKDLMQYHIAEDLLQGLVRLLRPTKESMLKQPEILTDSEAGHMVTPLPVFIQQAASAKCIGALVTDSTEIAEKLIKLRVVNKLLYAMGNVDHVDSQRQSAIAAQIFCQNFPIVDSHVQEAMGEALYELFMANPEALYTQMTSVQADILVNNKVNIPGATEENKPSTLG